MYPNEIHQTPEQKQAIGIGKVNQNLGLLNQNTLATQKELGRELSSMHSSINSNSDVLTDQMEDLIEAVVAAPKGTNTVLDDIKNHISSMSQNVESFSKNIQSIKGETGEQGMPGKQGIQGLRGEKGLPGKDGKQGIQGKEGKRGPVGPEGKQGIPGPEGKEGRQGIPGKDGKDGNEITPQEIASKINSLPRSIDFKSLRNVPEFAEKGENMNPGIGIGSTPPRWRDSNGAIISQLVTDIKLSTGITTAYSNGQITLTSPSTPGGGSPGGDENSVQYNKAGAFEGDDKFSYDDTTNTLGVAADYGANLTPPLVSGEWNLNADWAYGTSPDSLIKSGVTNNFAIVPTAATWVVAGTYYKVTFTVTALSGGSLTFSIGGVRSQLNITTTGTFSFYATAADTSKFEINPNEAAVLCTITAIDVTAVTADTGEINAEGDLSGRALNLQETIIGPSPRIILPSATNNDWTPGGRPRSIYLLQGGSYTVTGLFASQVNGQEMFIKNFSPSTYCCFTNQSASSTAENRFICNTSSDIYLQYGETLMLRYAGGTVNRWLIEKISNSATQMNGALPFQDYLNGLLANAEDLNIGTGNAGIKILGSSDITTVGDYESISQGTRTTWDDYNLTVKTYVQSAVGSTIQLIERGNDFILDEIKNEAAFIDRQRQISSKTLFTDAQGGGQTPANDTVLFEIRTGNDNAGTYRGMLIPSMSSSSAAGVVSAGVADYLLFHDTDCRMSFQWDNVDGVWRSVGNYSGTYLNSVTAVSTFTVTFTSATMMDTSYRVLVTAADGNSSGPFYVTNKTTTSFDIQSVAPITGSVAWDWLVTY